MENLYVIGWVIIMLTMYFLPTIIAVIRKMNIGSVMVINLFIGWTFFGWVYAMAKAIESKNSASPVQPVEPGVDKIKVLSILKERGEISDQEYNRQLKAMLLE